MGILLKIECTKTYPIHVINTGINLTLRSGPSSKGAIILNKRHALSLNFLHSDGVSSLSYSYETHMSDLL